MDEIEHILTHCRAIAVPGLSSKRFRAGYGVSDYMQAAGYRIIPINPREIEVLGEKSYPTLEAVPERIDLVNGLVMALLLLWFTCAAAQTPQFRYERAILPGGAGANRIAPDVALMSGVASADLRDLRLFDAAGKEVPYLTIPPERPEPRWKSGALLAIAPSKTSSGFEADLGSASLVDRIRVTGIAPPFLKRFRLEGSGDRSHWTMLVEEGTLFDLPDENLHLLDIPFRAGEYRYLRVTWDDRESGVVLLPRGVAGRLVEWRGPAPPLVAPVEFRKLSAGPGRSRFQVRLPGPHLPLAALELNVKEDRLLRTARITEGRLAEGEVLPQALGGATLRRVVRGNATASDLRIPIRAPEGREIEILVDDGDNPQLNLAGVTMEFVPLPWIYFESHGGEQLTARYGDSRLSAPRYDLEAMREFVGKTGIAEGRWGDSRDTQPGDSVTDANLPPIAGAPVNRQPFRFSRPIPASPAGLTALLLDAAVLAHSPASLADLRIADGTDHQIPYLLERCEDVLSLNLPPLVKEAPQEKKAAAPQSHYRLTLPYPNLPSPKLVLTTTDRVFERTVSFEISRPAADAGSRRSAEPNVEILAEAHWRHSDPETPAPPLIVELRPLSTTTLTVVVDEGDNSPLPLSAVRLELPLYRMRFFYPAGAKLTLLYGQNGLPAPRYDLALLAPRLVGVSSREAALDQENAAPAAPEKGATQTRVFWAALIGAVVVLLALLVRLLRS